MTDDELRKDGAIEYAHDILEGLKELAGVLSEEESITIRKVITTIEAMMQHDFNLSVDKLDS